MMQCKIRGADKSQMIPYNYELNNPYLMGYYTANKGAQDEHGCFPEYSHSCSILDRDLFGPYQKELSATAKRDYPNYNPYEYGELCWLFDNMNIYLGNRLSHRKSCRCN
eukprot:279599_1